MQARTYPKVWRDGVKGEIEERMKGDDAKMTIEEAREATARIAARSKSNLAPMTVSQLYPEAVEGAAKEAVKLADRIYDILKNELPAHTVRLYEPESGIIEKEDKNGDIQYVMKVGFRSPSGKTDTRTFSLSYAPNDYSDAEKLESKEFAEAVEQLIMEHGMDREEIIDGKRQSIDARRRKDD